MQLWLLIGIDNIVRLAAQMGTRTGHPERIKWGLVDKMSSVTSITRKKINFSDSATYKKW